MRNEQESPITARLLHDLTSEADTPGREPESIPAVDSIIVRIVRIIHTPEEDFYTIMHRALALIGRSLEAERVFVVEYFRNQPIIHYAWHDEGSDDAFDYSQELVEQKLNSSEPVRKEGGIYLVPYFEEKRAVGYLVAEGIRNEDTKAVKYLMDMSMLTIYPEIRMTRMVERLSFMGTHDQLTNVNNRNAMNMRICDLQTNDNPVGVAYVDVNGLKETNDRYGHEAGDARIIRMASVLSQVFARRDIYRAGGDEFVVIAAGYSEEGFNAKIKHLRALARQLELEARLEAIEGISLLFSMGYVWSPTSDNIEQLLKEADEKMYAEKSAYYVASGKDRRKGRKKEDK